jgi:CheY-like chemotaxis protein
MSAAAAQPIRVLLVDDLEDCTQVLSRLLQFRGFHVRSAIDGAGALREFEQFQPDVVVLDLAMPAMDGCEVARRIRQQPGGERVLLIVVSGYADALHRQASLDAGADDHLRKPADVEQITSLIRSTLERRRAREAAIQRYAPLPGMTA